MRLVDGDAEDVGAARPPDDARVGLVLVGEAVLVSQARPFGQPGFDERGDGVHLQQCDDLPAFLRQDLVGVSGQQRSLSLGTPRQHLQQQPHLLGGGLHVGVRIGAEITAAVGGGNDVWYGHVGVVGRGHVAVGQAQPSHEPGDLLCPLLRAAVADLGEQPVGVGIADPGQRHCAGQCYRGFAIRRAIQRPVHTNEDGNLQGAHT